MTQSFRDEILKLLSARTGHFLLESGHHGTLWLDLETLCFVPQHIRPLAGELARCLAPYDVQVICGPLVEGAFVGLLVAGDLGCQFAYSERYSRGSRDAFFPLGYRVPTCLAPLVYAKRVAIVNDVINAGSAVRGTFEALQDCGAKVVAIGTLLTLGNAAGEFAVTKRLALESLANMSNSVWKPSECPICATGVPLEDVGGFGAAVCAASD